MTIDFKTDEVIKCVNSQDAKHLTEGGHYKLLQIRDEEEAGLVVDVSCDDGNIRTFLAQRFSHIGEQN